MGFITKVGELCKITYFRSGCHCVLLHTMLIGFQFLRSFSILFLSGANVTRRHHVQRFSFDLCLLKKEIIMAIMLDEFYDVNVVCVQCLLPNLGVFSAHLCQALVNFHILFCWNRWAN